MIGATLIFVGCLAAWVGGATVREALKTGRFRAKFGSPYHEDPHTIVFWATLLIRATPIPVGITMVWLGTEMILLGDVRSAVEPLKAALDAFFGPPRQSLFP